MKEKPGRRSFIKKIGISGISAAVLPAGIVNASDAQWNINDEKKQAPEVKPRAYNTPYRGEYLNRVAFPIGGLGAGMFCMEGTGAISHMSVKNKPDIYHEPGIFAAVSIKGLKYGAKILEGPVPDWKKFGQRDAGNGATGAIFGLPRFRKAVFTTRFPFATIDLSDPGLPLQVRLTGWSPFIPGDENNSGMPVGAIEYSFKNTGTTKLEAVFSFNARNFLRIDNGVNSIRALPKGFVLHEEGTKEKKFPSSFAVFTEDAGAVINHCWFRGGWWDPLTMLWNSIKNGEVNAAAPVESGAPGATLYVPFALEAGASKTIKVMTAWYTPESDMTFGKIGERKENCDPASGCCASPDALDLDPYDKNFDGAFYKPWYSSRFKSIEEVCEYWKSAYNTLRKNSAL